MEENENNAEVQPPVSEVVRPRRRMIRKTPRRKASSGYKTVKTSSGKVYKVRVTKPTQAVKERARRQEMKWRAVRRAKKLAAVTEIRFLEAKIALIKATLAAGHYSL